MTTPAKQGEVQQATSRRYNRRWIRARRANLFTSITSLKEGQSVLTKVIQLLLEMACSHAWEAISNISCSIGSVEMVWNADV